jgi:peptide/nickel transport system substrate-binding protein
MRWLPTVLHAVAAAALVVSPAAVTAAAARNSTNSGVAVPRIIDGTTARSSTIDPANEYDTTRFTVDLNIFQGLYGVPNGAKASAVLAERDAITRGFTTWSAVRHGVKFSNGGKGKFASADVKYSFDRVLKIKGDQGIYTLLSALSSVTTERRLHGRLPPQHA